MSQESGIWRFWRIDATALSACLVMVVTLALGGLRPLVQRRAACQVQEQQLAREQDQLAAAQTTVSQTDRRLDALQRSLSGCSIRLETVGSLNRRLGELTALAGEMELKVNETASGKPVATEHYYVIPIRLNGTGAYDRCTCFVHQLRVRFPDIRLSRVELTGNPDGTGLLKLELRWYAAPMAGEQAGI